MNKTKILKEISIRTKDILKIGTQPNKTEKNLLNEIEAINEIIDFDNLTGLLYIDFINVGEGVNKFVYQLKNSECYICQRKYPSLIYGEDTKKYYSLFTFLECNNLLNKNDNNSIIESFKFFVSKELRLLKEVKAIESNYK